VLTEGFLALLLLIAPGLIADALYRFLLWRSDPDEHIRITRATLSSGVSLYVLLLLRGILPAHVPYPSHEPHYPTGREPGIVGE
jgi:hypothetical protein